MSGVLDFEDSFTGDIEYLSKLTTTLELRSNKDESFVFLDGDLEGFLAGDFLAGDFLAGDFLEGDLVRAGDWDLDVVLALDRPGDLLLFISD